MLSQIAKVLPGGFRLWQLPNATTVTFYMEPLTIDLACKVQSSISSMPLDPADDRQAGMGRVMQSD